MTKTTESGTSGKLSIILKAKDYVLSQNNGKERYITEVTALSKAVP